MLKLGKEAVPGSPVTAAEDVLAHGRRSCFESEWIVANAIKGTVNHSTKPC
jgi:hypothetical protein